MRATFFKTLEESYKKDKNIFVLTADLGFKLFDNFKKIDPNRFYDIGVAEANMIGIAAGLSLSNKNVYCYSIIPFLIMKTFEHVRIDIAYHNLNVKLIGVGGGFTYGLEGFTHFSFEDIALMRSLPNMTIVIPADPMEAKKVAELSIEYHGPMYIRLGRTGEPVIHDNLTDFKIGKAIILSEGKDVAIFATGNMVYVSKQVVELLNKKGLSTTLVNIHTLKPLEIESIKEISLSHKAIFSIEEHSIVGGLGSAISEVLAENKFNGIFKRIGIEEKINNHLIGRADFLREHHGLTPQKIYEKIITTINHI